MKLSVSFSFFALVLAAPVFAQRAQQLDRFVPGEIVVAPRPGQEVALDAALDASALQVIERDAISGAVRVRVPGGIEVAWIDQLTNWPSVAYAERNGLGQGGLVPDDTHYFRQYHLENTNGADIQAVDAWDITTGSSSVVVAVLDTGIDSDHPEFAGRIDPDGFDFVNEDADPEADHPHGTWVSGCVGANADNAFGVAGVDWNCMILPVKVLNASNGGTTFDLSQALNYCATQADVDVVCMSLINYPNVQILRDALAAARTAEKILVACAGNGGIGNADVSWPGASPDTISIGATTRQDIRASFSGTGSALDFVAAGQGVITTQHDTFNDTFASVSGCSFATPITSGVVSLLLARADELGMTLDQNDVYNLLLAGAEDEVGNPGEDTPGRDDFHGHGRINAYESLLALSPLAVPVLPRSGIALLTVLVGAAGGFLIARRGSRGV